MRALTGKTTKVDLPAGTLKGQLPVRLLCVLGTLLDLQATLLKPLETLLKPCNTLLIPGEILLISGPSFAQKPEPTPDLLPGGFEVTG